MDTFTPTGESFWEIAQLITKYGFDISHDVINADKKRLINQLWKVLPMRENEENWQKQLQTVQYEIIGLNEVFSEQLDFLILLCKLEALFVISDFNDFRKTIFESINLLGEIIE